MSSNSQSLGSTLKWFTILIIVFVLIVGGVLVYTRIQQQNNDEAKVTVVVDKTVIVQRVKKLSRLETVSQTMQRDIEVQIDAGALNFFNVPLFENTRVQKIAVTGSVTAGVDLNQLSQESIKNQEGKVTVDLPQSQVFNVNIIEDKTTILQDDLTLLFKFQDVLNDNRRREFNQLLQQQVIKQAKAALVDAACEDNILVKAGENSKTIIEELLFTSGYNDVEANYRVGEECGLELSS
ncbi:MAG: DUF4230 domain-containing protein [Patescibacteria group bacterium]